MKRSVFLVFALVACATFLLQPSPDSSANEPRPLVFSETIDFASAADGVGETGSIAAPGAQLGDFCIPSIPIDLQDMLLTCYVQAANVVEYRLQNESTATVNLASTTIRLRVSPANVP